MTEKQSDGKEKSRLFIARAFIFCYNIHIGKYRKGFKSFSRLAEE